MPVDRREARRAALAARLHAEELDALIVTHLPNIRYLTGFTGSSAIALVREQTVVLVTDFRYQTQAADEAGDLARIEVVESRLWERLWRVLEDLPAAAALAFEADAMSARTATRLADACSPRQVRPAVGIVEALRVEKDADEIEAIRHAAMLACDAFAASVPSIKTGVTERTVAATLEYALRERGSEWHPFPTIVASGQRSALPHARTSSRAIGRGEFVLLDFGAQVDGYCADLTRTVIVGRADDRQREVYSAVREAQGRAIREMRAGMTGAGADALARELLAARGFGESFHHSLGHGLGLEVHEAPRVSRTNDAPLQANAVVTVEPGVYLPGWGGVRIEDDVCLSAQATVLLSDGIGELQELT